MAEGKWLIKSSGRILGPWSLEEITDQIRGRQFSIFDEVREPRGSWTIVREHPQLVMVVRQIRDEHSTTVEKTQSTFVTTTKTVTSSVTEKLPEDTSLTPDPRGNGHLVSVRGSDRAVGAETVGGKYYGTLSDANVQDRLQRTRGRWVVGLYALVFFFFIGAFFVWKNQKGTKLTPEQAEDLYRQSVDYSTRGEYRRASENLERLALSRPLTPQEAFLQAKLLLAIDDSSAIDLARVVDGLKPDIGTSQVNLDLMKGLVQVRLSRFKEAAIIFDRILQSNPTNEEAALNRAACALEMGEVFKSWSILKTPHFNRLRSHYQLLKTFTALKMDDKVAKRQAIEEFQDFDLVEDKDRTRDAGREFYFEKLLLLAGLSHQAGLPSVTENYRKKLVQANPFESANYLKPILLDWQIVNWPALLKVCDTLRATSQDSGLTRAIWSLCLVGSGDMVNALSVVDQSSKLFSNDSSLIAVQALMLYQAGRKVEAERIVKLYPNSDKSMISWIRGLLCEERVDHECALKSWEQVRAIDKFEPRALFGLARASKDLGNDSQYISSSTLATRYAPSYRPLLQLTGGKYDF